MPFPIPFHQSPADVAPAAIVRVVSRDDVLWNRPVFRAPPLHVVPPLADVAEFARAVRKPEAIAS